MKPKFRKLALLLVLAVTPLSPAADRNERIRELGSKFICVCGGCNNAIVAYFTDKYGITVLSAPPVSGFNLTAWVMPFAALAIGLIMALYFLRRFRTRWAAPAELNPDLAKYQDKVEEELKKFTPED